MPYESTAELPSSVKGHLPERAQEIYMKAFNSGYDRFGDEGRAARIAWGAVKKAYHKDERGNWVKGPSPT